MFDVPGFNPSAMSDEELLNKQLELSRRLGWAARFSGSNMSDQFLTMIRAIEMERRDRVLRYMFSEREKLFPEIIETEPDLAAQNKREIKDAELDDQMVQRRKLARERLTMKKTSAPTQVPPQNFPHYRDDEKVSKTSTPDEGKDNG